ncbi:DUF1542 domain-containing protein [Fructobacillus sp. M158]|uniref:DUF1542 domain-containing protein n=1 Tax=Fructobacillus parabroussonetiae TaxID=2713174 RepID=UPI00200A38FB|nr:DUF1542 domain-containing protein [Fructobacillus parabroussonetiae]MCK8617174.1 DUF1542 domain-containing protein [Fructobacillus parabroussonetiae]
MIASQSTVMTAINQSTDSDDQKAVLRKELAKRFAEEKQRIEAAAEKNAQAIDDALVTAENNLSGAKTLTAAMYYDDYDAAIDAAAARALADVDQTKLTDRKVVIDSIVEAHKEAIRKDSDIKSVIAAMQPSALDALFVDQEQTKQSITNLVTTIKSSIANDPELSKQQKEANQLAVDKMAQQYETAINQSSTAYLDLVNKNGKPTEALWQIAVEGRIALSDERANAKEQLKAAYQAALLTIEKDDTLPNVSADGVISYTSRDQQVAALTTIWQQANRQIDNAKTIDAIDATLSKELNEITQVHAEKKVARQKLIDQANTALDFLDNLNRRDRKGKKDVSKDSAYSEVYAALKQALATVDEATSLDEVSTLENQSNTSLTTAVSDAINRKVSGKVATSKLKLWNQFTAVRDQAINAIKARIVSGTQSFDNGDRLTQGEADRQIAAIMDISREMWNQIVDDNTTGSVKSAENAEKRRAAGKKAKSYLVVKDKKAVVGGDLKTQMDRVAGMNAAKTATREKLAEKAKALIAEIEADKANRTDAERAAAIDKITKSYNESVMIVDRLTDLTEVEMAADTESEKMDRVADSAKKSSKTPEVRQQDRQEDLEAARDAAKKKVEQSNLTDDEKALQKEALDHATTTAVEQLKAQNTANDIESAYEAGLKIIQGLTDAQNASRQKLQAEAQAAIDRINQENRLSEDAKQALIDQVNDALMTYQKLADQTKTVVDAAAAGSNEDFTKTLNLLTDFSKLSDPTQPSSDDEEAKEALRQALDVLAETQSKTAVSSAGQAGLTESLANLIATNNGVKPLADQVRDQQAALQEIADHDATTKPAINAQPTADKDGINQNGELTAAEKEEQRHALDQAVSDYGKDFANAKDADELVAKFQAAAADLKQLTTEKQEALTDLATKAQAAIDHVNDAQTGWTKAQAASAVQNIENAYQTVAKAIHDAKTMDAVKAIREHSVLDDAIKTSELSSPSSLSDQIEAAQGTVTDASNHLMTAEGLTDRQKEALKEAAGVSNETIGLSNDADDLLAKENAALDNLQKLIAAQESAKAALDKTAGDAIRALQNEKALTDNEKATKKAAIEAALISVKETVETVHQVADLSKVDQTALTSAIADSKPAKSWELLKQEAKSRLHDLVKAERQSAVSTEGADLTEQDQVLLSIDNTINQQVEAANGIDTLTTLEAKLTADVKGLSSEKAEALSHLSEQAKQAIEAIEANNDLYDQDSDAKEASSERSKATRLTQVANELVAAQKVINEASKIGDVAVPDITNSALNVQNVRSLKDKKASAIAEVKAAYQQELNALDQADLKQAEHDRQKKALDQLLVNATTAISGSDLDKGDRASSVEKSKQQAVANLTGLTASKQLAEDDLKAMAQQAIEEIQADTKNRTDSDILHAVQHIQDVLSASLSQVDRTVDQTAVKTAGRADLEKAILAEKNAQLPSLTERQDAALKAIDQAATDAISEAEKKAQSELATGTADFENPDSPEALTKKAYERQIQAIKDAASAARTQVRDAETATAVEEAMATGIDNLSSLSSLKEAARREVADKVKNAIRDVQDNADIPKAVRETKLAEIQAAYEDVLVSLDNEKQTTAIQGIADDTQFEKRLETAVRYDGPDLNQQKIDAETAINRAAETAKQLMAENSDLDKEAKNRQQEAIDQAVKAAVELVQNATTADQITDNRDNGIAVIDSFDQGKKVAYQAIDEAAQKAKDAIYQNTVLSNDAKQDQKDAIDEAVNTAKSNIDTAASKAAIVEATNAGQAVVNQLNDQKKDAHKAIDDSAQKAKNAVDQNAELSDQAKQDQKNAIDEAAQAEKSNIDKAANKPAIDEAQLKGQENIAKLDDQKKDAYKAIDDSVQKAKDAIDQNAGLSDQAKQDQKNAVDEAAQAEKSNIDKAANKPAIDDAKQNGQQAIKQLDEQKKDAYKGIDDSVQKAKDAVDQNAGLSDQAKQDQKDAVDEAAQDAKSAIDNATNKPVIDGTKQNGQQAIEQLDEQKKDAYKDIDDSAWKAKDTVDQNTGLSDQAKQDQKNAIDEAAQAEKSNIDKASNKQAIDDAKQNGQQTIEQLNDQKKDAHKAIDDSAQKAKDAVDQNAGLSDQAKQDQKNAIDEAAKAEKSNIDKAVNKPAIDEAKANGQDNIAKLNDQKDEAKKAIDTAAQEAKDAVDQNAGLSDQAKQHRKDAIDEAVKAEKSNIDKASNKPAIDDAQQTGQDNIAKLNDQKDEAQKAIDTAAQEAKDVIDQNAELSDQAKQDRKDAIDEAAKAEKSNIDKASNKSAIDEAQSKGQDNIADLNDQKKDAYKDIDDSAQKAKDAVDQNSKLDDEAKQQHRDSIDDAAKTAKSEIDAAKNADEINQGAQNGRDQINGLTEKKEQARETIDQSAASAKKAIDENDRLSDQAKENQKAAVDKVANDTKADINKANKSRDVDDAVKNGQRAIEQLNDQKDEAHKAIDDSAQKAKEAVDQNAGLSDQAKQDQKKAIDEAAQAEKSNIDKAANKPAIDDAQSNGQDNIAKLNDQKKDAYKGIDDSAQKAKDAVDQNAELSDQAKQDRKDAIDEAAQAEKSNIDKAANKPAIDEAQSKGQDNISKLDDQKKDAYQGIDDSAQKAKNAVDQNAGLDNQAKQNQKNAIDEAAQAEKSAIDKAANKPAIDDAQAKGQENISKLDDQKKDAHKAIDDSDQKAKDAVDQNAELSDQAKQDQKNAIDETAKAEKSNIDKAANKPAIDDVKQNGQQAIEQLNDQKKDAHKDIDDSAQKAKDAVDQNAELSDQAKQDQKKAIDEAVQEAKTQVDRALNQVGIDEAKVAGQTAIDQLRNQKVTLTVTQSSSQPTNPTLPSTNEEDLVLPNTTDVVNNTDNAVGTTSIEETATTDQVSDVPGETATDLNKSKKNKKTTTTAKGNGIWEAIGTAGIAVAGFWFFLIGRKKKDEDD